MPKILCEYKELKDPDDIKPNPNNRNKHGDDQIERLAKLIKAHGFRHPIIVSTLTGQCVAGHGRLLAAKRLGLEKIPVDYQDFESTEQEYQFAISDNAIADWAELDLSGIHQDLPELEPFDVELLGLKNFEFEPEPDKDKGENQKEDTGLCPRCGQQI